MRRGVNASNQTPSTEKVAMIFEIFTEPLDKHWIQTCTGGGKLYLENTTLRMAFDSARQGVYTDAQIDDYGHLKRSDFPWRPPLRLNVVARSSLPAATLRNYDEDTVTLQGTAGFGFWNYPFSVKGDILMLPEAVWFFYASPPSNMALVPGIPGWGWKAQVVHSMQARSLAASVPLAATIAFGRTKRQYTIRSTLDAKGIWSLRGTFASRDG